MEATLILLVFLIKIQKKEEKSKFAKKKEKFKGLVWSNILPINISIQQTKRGGEQKKKRGNT